jgi:pantothenate kinase
LQEIIGFSQATERAVVLASRPARTLLGIAGAPGSGKSTLAEAIAREVGEPARIVGMDGFHLAQGRLAELDRLSRLGAVDTFDAAGFVSLVHRLRDAGEGTVYAPEFRREVEEATAGVVPIEPEVRLVIVEGNYLLLSEPPWDELRRLLDEIWYVERDEESRLGDLIARHMLYGKSEDEARNWARGSDEVNAEVVSGSRHRADFIVSLAPSSQSI